LPVDYLRGAIAAGVAAGAHVPANVDIAIAGDVPIGLGLSSSAALCVVLCLALHDPPPAGRDLVLRAQEAEHRAGTPCGTMDQSASVGGEVILYDGATTTWDGIEPRLGGYVFAVADSGVARVLGESSYPRRVAESRSALESANRILGRDHGFLADISLGELAALEGVSGGQLDSTFKKRIRHVVTEVDRVRQGVEAVRARDWVRFGALMNASGRSSATDYEISHPRVEELVACARAGPGVAGARMMGGGEGGAALILVVSSAVEELREALDTCYFEHNHVPRERRLQVFRAGRAAARLTP
jgi:galactokinase